MTARVSTVILTVTVPGQCQLLSPSRQFITWALAWAELGSGLRPALTHQVRDCKRISKLPVLQLILPYKIACISGSLEIPLLSLHQVAPRPSGATKAGPLPDICPSSPFSEYCILVCFGTMKARLIAVIGWNNERSREVSTMDVFARLSCRDAPSPIYTLRWYCNFWGFTLFY